MDTRHLLETLVDTAQVQLGQNTAHAARSLEALARLLIDRGAEIDRLFDQIAEE